MADLRQNSIMHRLAGPPRSTARSTKLIKSSSLPSRSSARAFGKLEATLSLWNQIAAQIEELRKNRQADLEVPASKEIVDELIEMRRQIWRVLPSCRECILSIPKFPQTEYEAWFIISDFSKLVMRELINRSFGIRLRKAETILDEFRQKAALKPDELVRIVGANHLMDDIWQVLPLKTCYLNLLCESLASALELPANYRGISTPPGFQEEDSLSTLRKLFAKPRRLKHVNQSLQEIQLIKGGIHKQCFLFGAYLRELNHLYFSSEKAPSKQKLQTTRRDLLGGLMGISQRLYTQDHYESSEFKRFRKDSIILLKALRTGHKETIQNLIPMCQLAFNDLKRIVLSDRLNLNTWSKEIQEALSAGTLDIGLYRHTASNPSDDLWNDIAQLTERYHLRLGLPSPLGVEDFKEIFSHRDAALLTVHIRDAHNCDGSENSWRLAGFHLSLGFDLPEKTRAKVRRFEDFNSHFPEVKNCFGAIPRCRWTFLVAVDGTSALTLRRQQIELYKLITDAAAYSMDILHDHYLGIVRTGNPADRDHRRVGAFPTGLTIEQDGNHFELWLQPGKPSVLTCGIDELESALKSTIFLGK